MVWEARLAVHAHASGVHAFHQAFTSYSQAIHELFIKLAIHELFVGDPLANQ